MELIDEVYGCQACPSEEFGFTRWPERSGYYKFPPIIGACRPVPLLFVGINPRRSDSNLALHRELSRYPDSFRVLAANRVPYSGQGGGPRYISVRGPEKHYRMHAHVVTELFGHSAAFEDFAAVTELFLCASENSAALPRTGSPCADRFLSRVVHRIQPEVVIAVGSLPHNYLMARTDGESGGIPHVELDGHGAWLLAMTHPRFGSPLVESQRIALQIKHVRSRRWRAAKQTTHPQMNDRIGPTSPESHAAAPPPIHAGKTPEADPRRWSLPTVGPWWAEILNHRGSSSRQSRVVAPILASHPDALELTAELLEDLTVWRFIRIANIEHNKLRPEHILGAGDELSRSRAAWELLFHGLATVQMTTKADVANGRRETNWIRVAAKLEHEAAPALAYLQSVPIATVIAACENLIAGPYRKV